MFEEGLNADILIDFVKRLPEDAFGKEVFLILDNPKVHHAKEIEVLQTFRGSVEPRWDAQHRPQDRRDRQGPGPGPKATGKRPPSVICAGCRNPPSR